MKVTQEQLLAVAKLAGLDVEVVENSTDSDYNSDTALQAIDAQRSKILMPKWEQEFGERLEGNANAKLANIIERALVKATGVPKEKFTPEMKDSERINVAIDHYKNTLQGEQGDIQKKIDDILAKHSTERDSLVADYESKLGMEKERFNAKETMEYLGSVLSKAPLNERTDKTVAARNFHAYLKDKYHLTWDEAKKAAALFTKDNTKMPALNAAGTSNIDLLDEAKEYFTPLGIWETDTRSKDYDPTKGQNYQPNKPSTTGRGASSLDEMNKQIDATLQQAGLPTA